MKYLNTLALIILCLPTSGYAAFILEGEYERYNFSTLDFTQTSTILNDGANLQLGFANSFEVGGLSDPYLYNGKLETGETIQIDLYENQNDLTPFQTYTLMGQEPVSDLYVYVWSDFLNSGTVFIPWLDLEGSIVVTSISGEIELNAPGITVFDSGIQYNASLSVATVPLPPSLPLFAVSLFSLFVYRYKGNIKT